MDEENLQLAVEEWEQVGHTIGKLSVARENLATLRKQKIELRKLWSTYKFYNHTQPWYTEIIYRLGADIKDANRYQDELGPKYYEYVIDDPDYQELTSKDQGMKIYNRLETVKRDIADEIAIVGELTMDLWELGIPLKDVAKAYGASENTTYIFITRQPRFKKRREHPQSPTVDTTDQST